jgi:hypothetical protein
VKSISLLSLIGVQTQQRYQVVGKGASPSSPVSPGTGQHLVDANDVERVEPNSNMKAVFATTFYHVLVGTNTGSLQG